MEKIKHQFQISKLEGEHITSLSETTAGKARMEELTASGDIKFLGRTTETVANYDKATREYRPATTIKVARYIRNAAAEAGRSAEHHAAVISALQEETADVILVTNSKTGEITQYPKEYLQTAYKVMVLDPEIKALTEATTSK